MSTKEKLLENLGLKDTTVKIYLYLLKAKKATVLEVAKETGVARTNIYNNVSRLIQMGLVGEAIEGGKKFLIPESPNNLINFVRTKEDIAKQAAGLLQADFETNKYESKIRF
jgi:sugar-specific transcriptional regulator TrmB